MSEDKLVWIDIETFGLVPADCPIIEVGMTITDLELNHIKSIELNVWEPWYKEVLNDLMRDAINGDKNADYVFKMHQSSNLWSEARSQGMPTEDAKDVLVSWLEDDGIDKSDPMCGSSVQFDRNMLAYHMPEVHEIFSYRNIDVSTVKELCKRYNPTIYSHLAIDTNPAKRHRVLSDLDDTIAEFKFYRDEFLLWQD